MQRCCGYRWWACGGSVYVPSSGNILARAMESTEAEASRRASYATSACFGKHPSCLIVDFAADRWAARGALGFYFLVMSCSSAWALGYVLSGRNSDLLDSWPALLHGRGRREFAVYTLWLPEQMHRMPAGSASP